MNPVQVWNKLIDHPKDGAERENSGSNAKYCQESSDLVMP
jgi:hypothetical protein